MRLRHPGQLLLMTGSIPAQAKLRYLLIMMAGSGLKFEQKKSSHTASIVRNQYYTNLKQVEHLPAPTIIPFAFLVLFYLINSMECVLSNLKLYCIRARDYSSEHDDHVFVTYYFTVLFFVQPSATFVSKKVTAVVCRFFAWYKQ